MTAVSIIIPVFNRQEILFETLDSIRAQTFTDWECVLVDDHSTDTTLEIMKHYAAEDSRFIVYSRPDHLPKGACSCRNYGFSQANGRYIQWFDSDDIMDAEMIKKKVTLLETDPKLRFVVSRMANFDSDFHVTSPIEQQLTSDNLIYDFLKYDVIFLTPGPLFRKEYLALYELFNPHLKRHQEWEFFFRLVLDLPEYAPLDEVLAYRRMHAGSIRSQILQEDQLHRKKLHLVSRLMGLKYLVRQRNHRMTEEIKAYFTLLGKNAVYEGLKFRNAGLVILGSKFLYWLRWSEWKR